MTIWLHSGLLLYLCKLIMSNQTFWLLLLICMASAAAEYSKSTTETSAENTDSATESFADSVSDSDVSNQSMLDAGAATQTIKPPAFQCDGRRYCSEMSSLQEARYFLVYCPTTEMDGDHDGEPCENDTRFHSNR